MNDLKSDILMVVAMPKQFLWAPFELAIVNIVLSVMVMMLCISTLGLTPFWAILPLVLGHAALVGAGTTNPHLTTTLRAMGTYPLNRRKNNISKISHGVKYVP